jgi:hypothetical protein
MTDDERARAVRRLRREAEATVERLKWLDDVGDDEGDGHVGERVETKFETTSDLPPLPDPVERWREEMDAIAAERERAKAEIAAASRPAVDWDEVDRRIRSALERERLALAETFGEEVGRLLNELRDATRADIREVRNVCDKFVGDMTAAVKDFERGKVVDMPSPLSRRRSVVN